MLGIIGAMEKETDALFSAMTECEEKTIGYSRYVKGKLKGMEIVLARGGIGKVHAAMCAQMMIEIYKPSAVLNIGVAGALDDRLGISDIVIATSGVQHDIDTTPIGDPLGLISGPNIVHVPCDEGLRKQLVKAAGELKINFIEAAIATGDQFICGAERKRSLGQAFGAGACDMEGGAIAQVCYEYSVPYAAYRAISDTVEGSGRQYAECAHEAGMQSAKLLGRVLENMCAR